MSIPTPATVDRNDVQAAAHPDLIAAAQSGDTAAADTLYRSVITNLRAWSREYSDTIDFEDALAAASLAFSEAVADFVPGKGASFLGLLRTYVTSALTDAGRQGGKTGRGVRVSVPERTLKRFYAILRAADYDLARGLEIAASKDMATDTFRDLYYALASDDGAVTEDDEAEVYLIPDPSSVELQAEETLLLETAWKAVDDFETDVCRLAYGFSDYRPNSDGEIAEKLGYGRATIQRRRQGALSKMRVSLGLPA